MNSLLVKKVLAVHDLSCVGRCSLSVILPILSAIEVQVCPLPTAILSTHLGGFSTVSFSDFSSHIPSFSAHWQREGVQFDSIYSGFLASTAQIEIVSQLIDDFSASRPLVLVDPVMGDEGNLYSVYTVQMQEKIKKLVRQADIITPNYTEACFLLGQPYVSLVSRPELLEPWLIKLSELGPQQIVITGVPLANQQVANLSYDRITGQLHHCTSKLIPARYPGTGDIFASVLLGELLRGTALPDAVERAGSFVFSAVAQTYAAATPTREGVLLERSLKKLLEAAHE
jgi:pyridoxine kinase